LIPIVVRNEIDKIAEAVDRCVYAFQNGGRLIYLGAGTSGRIGILDAAECPPTFGTKPEIVQGMIAGGSKAVFQAVEGAEDNIEDGINTITQLNISPTDVVCGLSASGRTP
jgi:N-acetylmuramic acid 6-phosphate etherase